MTERVFQWARDSAARIVRRELDGKSRPFVDYVVEVWREGAWIRTGNGPWDYLYNARAELEAIRLGGVLEQGFAARNARLSRAFQARRGART